MVHRTRSPSTKQDDISAPKEEWRTEIVRDRLKVNRVSEILGIKVSFRHETKFEAAALLKEFSSSTEARSLCRNILSDASSS